MSDCKHEAALRRHADGWRTPQADDMRAAADHIAAQRAEIERLTRRGRMCAS